MTKLEEVLEQRGSRYGDFKDNAELAQKLLRIVQQSPGAKRLTPVHTEAIHMIFHKISRMVNGDPWYNDNMVDVAGYAKLLEGFINAHNENNASYEKAMDNLVHPPKLAPDSHVYSPVMLEGGE